MRSLALMLAISTAAAGASAAPLGTAMPMDEEELAAVSGAGLEPTSLAALLQGGVTLSAPRPQEILQDALRALTSGTTLDQQSALLSAHTAGFGLNANITAAGSLGSLAVLGPVLLPMMIPVLALPLFGLTALLPPPPKKG